MNKKVCVLTTAHQADDVRIFHKECRSLSKAGYEVILIAGHPYRENADGVKIIPLGSREGRAYRFLIKGWAALWKAIKIRADIYHFHDPDLIPAALLLKLLGKKVIYDVHEDVPKDILTKEWLGGLCIRKLISFVCTVLLKFASLFLDRIIAATPSISKAFPSNKTIVLRNVPNILLIDDIKPETLHRVKPTVVYAGGLSKIRGIREIIDAAGLLEGLVELWLLGWWEDSGYERQCMSSTGWRYVRYFGTRSLEQTYSFMKRADIGIVNFMAIPNSVESLPNKAFEYLNCGLPVIMSEFAYWKDLFGKCAVFVNPVDPKSIAAEIKNLIENRELRMKLAGEGRRLLEDEYSWESESKKLIELYNNLDGGVLSEINNSTWK